MREILFKGKTEGGRWIEGDLIHYESGEVAIFEKFSKYGYEATEICRRTEVLPETVCQFTGLYDKNGNKIWENDIVEVVVCNEKGDIQLFKGIIPIMTDYITLANISVANEIEVIGNIFDNPELIGERK